MLGCLNRTNKKRNCINQPAQNKNGENAIEEIHNGRRKKQVKSRPPSHVKEEKKSITEAIECGGSDCEAK